MDISDIAKCRNDNCCTKFGKNLICCSLNFVYHLFEQFHVKPVVVVLVGHTNTYNFQFAIIDTLKI